MIILKIKISDELREKTNPILLSIEATVKVKEGNDALWNEINSKIKEITENITPSDILKIKNIDSSRTAYKKLGKDPSRYRLSSESLLKRIVKGNGLYKVNNVVDINNLISLTTSCPVGIYDLSKTEGDIILTIGKEGEVYEGIGRGEIKIEHMPTFADSIGNFGTTTSDSIRAMITEDTHHIVMNLVSFSGEDELLEFSKLAKRLLAQYADAEILSETINR
ncbi:phenylalanine--tRNA ligase beta subunit-related protein [uncultured Clostridium sp.]|uniref:B3/B4 domain-containing protein n=1 Tax=uncultured Clostridium sp. TaxID=59620 RepID=UPI0026044B0A|nr:phenylalanine--tRNA ligase beta subunit-related protein [uncultured Clostridium sp.]